MIHLALLLGSDYTDGISGIGIVTAMQIISKFDNLNDFRIFIESTSAVVMDQIYHDVCIFVYVYIYIYMFIFILTILNIVNKTSKIYYFIRFIS